MVIQLTYVPAALPGQYLTSLAKPVKVGLSALLVLFKASCFSS
jgi:hypothetical protein